MKKALYLASALAVAGLTFSTVYANNVRSHAVVAKSKCTTKGSISYWFWGDKGDALAQKHAIASAEKECPGIHVDGIWKQGDYDTALATAIGSGNAPDVFQLDPGKRLPEFVTQHAMAKLNSFAKKDHFNPLNVYWHACAQQAYYRGGLYGLVRDCGNNQMLIYNKEMFKARHVALPTNKWTLKNFLKAAKKLTGTYGVPHDKTVQPRWAIPIQQDEYRINGYILPFGGNWLTAPDKHGHVSCNLTSKGSRAGLTYWRNLIYKYHVAPTPQQQSTAGGDFNGFHNERFAMYFVGPWALDYLVKPSPQTGGNPVPWKWGVALNPANPAHPKQVGLGVVDPAIEAVYSRSKHKQAAWEFIRHLTTGKGAVYEAKFGIGIPGYYPLSRSKAFKKEYAPYTKTWLRGNNTGQSLRTVPKHEQWVDQAYSPAMTHLFDGSMTVKQATASACKAGKPFMP